MKKRKCSLLLKRLFDLFVSFLGLIIFGPLILLLGFLIKLSSPGPMFYKQKRLGENGKIFTLYKIRTMRADAEELTGPIWAKKNDPRIVKGGYFLRRYHLDELPQFINIIKGEMSLVGPRPERPEIAEKLIHLIPGYNRRLLVKPGITGYAQIRHKYDESIRDVKIKIRYELFYIRRMCFMLDLKIVFSTIRIILTGKDDYKSIFRRLNYA